MLSSGTGQTGDYQFVTVNKIHNRWHGTFWWNWAFTIKILWHTDTHSYGPQFYKG